MFLLYRLNLGPPFGPLRLGAPGFSRSEPIVVTPLSSSTHLVLEWRISKKTFDSHSPEAVCNSPVLAIMTT
jgi:hypothetical protein